MHLKRVRVPDFRVLKDVDITFEKEFTPRIFPLGSQNGGGKSTLLQLIFVLLHCSPDPEKSHFIKNMIDGFKLRDGEETRTLAIFNILDNKEEAIFEFFVCDKLYIQKIFDPEEINESITFSVFSELENNRNEISKVKDKIDHIEDAKSLVESNPRKNEELLKEKKLFNKLVGINSRLLDLKNKILEKLKANSILYITNYSAEDNNDQKKVLLCQVINLNLEDAESLLKRLSNKVFLAAPSTQVFLFLSRKAKMSLFQSSEYIANNYHYHYYLNRLSLDLTGLFKYDFFHIDLLIELFKAARDKDFQIAIATGAYGNHYQTLLNELNSLLTNKKLNLKADLSGVSFSMDNGNEIVELGPEDLSHGELKRLSIYMWIRYRNIEDAIVLMDEIEIAFHPDWQYRIIADLQDWGPNNQYILATHSYSLCEALTPAHVKEIEPKLLPVKVNL